MNHAPTPQVTAGSSAAIFLVVVASYIIAWWSSRRERDARVTTYLFGGNSASLGLSSSIGTIISMAVGFTALLSAGFVFGWQILFSILPGGAAGLWVILRFVDAPIIRAGRNRAFATKWKYGATHLAFLSMHRAKSFLLYYAVAMIFYAAMLATEVAVLRGAFRFFLNVDENQVTLLTLSVLVVCISYVYIGGFRGVLVTDYFQLLVVIAFIGSVLPHVLRRELFEAIPPPTVAAIQWTRPSLVLLHIGAFCGAFAWTAGNLDQWLRTMGTLRDPTAKKTLRFAATVIYLCAILPVLAGSVALASGLPPSLGNTASLHLLRAFWNSSNATGRFLLIMAIGCAALTTLNTYIMTMQQLYYEFSVLMVSETPPQYAVEWILKWRSVRKVVFVITTVAVAASLLINETNVYTVGVFASCGYIFFALPVLLEITPLPRARTTTAPKLAIDTACLVGSLILFSLTLLFLRSRIGALGVHLYLLPAAAGMAVSVPMIAKMIGLIAPDEEGAS